MLFLLLPVCLVHTACIVDVDLGELPLTEALTDARSEQLHEAAEATPWAKHVIIIGLDGCMPAGIHNADTPNLDALWKSGAYTWKARTVMPSSSGASWASILMGAGPEEHGVTTNGWRPSNAELPPIDGTAGMFPGLFTIAKKQRPELRTAAYYHWQPIERLIDPKAVDSGFHGVTDEAVTEAVVAHILEARPNLLFIHLDEIDGAGHGQGYMSAAYLEAITRIDGLIGRIVTATRQAQTFDDTLFLVTADHGGTGTGHGSTRVTDMEVPWIAMGPGVLKGRQLTGRVRNMDIAATAADALGLAIPEVWVAQPIKAIRK